MSQKTSIEWTDATWNPVRGCSRVSQGCVNCYAERVAARFSKDDLSNHNNGDQPFHGFAILTPSGPRWTGKVELVEKHLEDPLHWKTPRRIFVNSMSDLFHEALLDEAIDRVFVVMGMAEQHTFQILTKRPERMLCYFQRRQDAERQVRALGWSCSPVALPNVWLGVSVEDQKTADERIPLLLQTPAAVRFVSYEPALGPVDFARLAGAEVCPACGVHSHRWYRGIDWIIVGGESGPGARPFDVDWARAVVQQCKAAGVACFVKQLGAYVIQDGEVRKKADRKGGDWHEWPHDLRVREFPKTANGKDR